MSHEGPERRAYQTISEEDLDKIAERAAEKAFEKIYSTVGKGVLTRLAWLVGAAALGIIYWLGSKGIPLK